jgi:hypothetical protein
MIKTPFERPIDIRQTGAAVEIIAANGQTFAPPPIQLDAGTVPMVEVERLIERLGVGVTGAPNPDPATARRRLHIGAKLRCARD